MIRFFHLSDIHFHYATSNSPYDLDRVIRHELVLDAAKMSADLNGVFGVLTSGDVAFSGKQSEYEIAYNWLNELCQAIGCSSKHVWTVPGNHDVDRSRIKGVPLAEIIHQQLRQTLLREVNDQLRSLLSNAQSRKLLFDPLANYNAFAANFGCCSTADPLYWERDFPLNDGSTLRLRGMNSALVSDQNDTDENEVGKLILSNFQTNFERADDVIHATMCHHPPEWLRDRSAISDWFDAHARLQLFGHRHVQRIKLDADNVRVASGAMQPERNEAGWEPRYNVIGLEVVRDAQGRRLRIEIHQRVWNDTAKEFKPDNLGVYTRELPLKDRRPAASSKASQPAELGDDEEIAAVVAAIKPDLLELESIRPQEEVNIVKAGERLTSRYMSLPHSLQTQIARSLELYEEADRGAPDTELYRRYFLRAKERKLLERLWSEVESIYVERGEEPATVNPFAGR